MEELPATVVIHDNRLVHPIGLYYNKKYNIVIVHAISGTTGVEWKIAEYIDSIAKELNVKEIVSLEGVGSGVDFKEPQAFYFSNRDIGKKIAKMCSEVKPLREGIIMGVTSALLLKTDKPITAFFADTHSDLPDSKAAAKIIEVLDCYLGLKIDTKPLLQTAEKFEEKIKGMLEKSKVAQTQQQKKQLSYVG